MPFNGYIVQYLAWRTLRYAMNFGEWILKLQLQFTSGYGASTTKSLPSLFCRLSLEWEEDADDFMSKNLPSEMLLWHSNGIWSSARFSKGEES